MTLLRMTMAMVSAAARAGKIYPVVAVLIAMHPASAADGRPLPWATTPSAVAAYGRAADIAALGKKMFFDPNLSASGRMACATCHDPAHAFSAPDPSPVRLGGPDLQQAGTRAVPSLTYAGATPTFSEHHFISAEEGDESVDQGPTGGRGWDGRTDRARDQAALPMLDSNEMANDSPQAVLAAAQRKPYAAEVRRLYGQDVFANPAKAFRAITEALEFFQEDPQTFTPFTSKYDAFLAGRTDLTEQEARGLVKFDNPSKGNCASCHHSAVTPDGNPPLFTDFGFVALGLPRNPAIPANNDPAYFDLGLCGPRRHDLAAAARYCGMFKAPSLRNVALKQSFYHNGVFHSLRDAVAFYAGRDTEAGKWYPTGADGVVHKFDDLPPRYVGNVSMEPPFGQERALWDADVDDLVAFLWTLTDGYQSNTAGPPTLREQALKRPYR